MLSADGVKPDRNKTRAINGMPMPTDKKSLQRFIGLVQFLGHWLPYLADIKRPLCLLLRNATRKRRSDITASINSVPGLYFFNPSKSAVIQCDASLMSLSAVLIQEDQPHRVHLCRARSWMLKRTMHS